MTGKTPGTARAPNLGVFKHETQFCVGQFVLIDGDPNMRGRVVGINIHAGGTDYKVSYFHNGCNYEPTFDEFRLVACDAAR